MNMSKSATEYANSLRELRDQKLQAVVDLTTALTTAVANPQPSYNIDGQSVNWNGYLLVLGDQQKKEIEALDMLNDLISKVEPYQFVSRMV